LRIAPAGDCPPSGGVLGFSDVLFGPGDQAATHPGRP
jgi:hypothetical protein